MTLSMTQERLLIQGGAMRTALKSGVALFGAATLVLLLCLGPVTAQDLWAMVAAAREQA